MIEEIKRTLRHINDQEMFDLLAEVYKGIFNSLIARGFTRGEAMTLVKEMTFINNK